MKFNLFTLLISATLTASALANPIPASQCTTGPIQCCNSSGTADDPSIAKILGLLGVVVTDPTVLIGVTCSPINIIGAGAAACTGQTLCCKDNSFNGVIAIGCTPVDISL